MRPYSLQIGLPKTSSWTSLTSAAAIGDVASQALKFSEKCRFAFGPAESMPSAGSAGRYLYPAGIAGELVFLGISEVEAAACQD